MSKRLEKDDAKGKRKDFAAWRQLMLSNIRLTAILSCFVILATSLALMVPVISMTQEAAEAALTEAGFKFEWLEEGRYSSQIPEGLVLVQMPAAGRTAKLGRTVKLTKSLGLR